MALANHEIGNIYDVAAFAKLTKERGAIFFADAVQAAGRIAIDVGALGVDALAISAHKIGGPKGVGALYVRSGLFPEPVLAGGHQERERRPGTENLIGIAGFAAAARAAQVKCLDEQLANRVRDMRDRLEKAALARISGGRVHGGHARMPGTTNLGFSGAPGEQVVIALDLEGICVSMGAACTSGSVEPSPVIKALGYADDDARQAVRISLSDSNTDAEIDRMLDSLEKVVARVRRAYAG